jgi:hypothetical protein
MMMTLIQMKCAAFAVVAVMAVQMGVVVLGTFKTVPIRTAVKKVI